MNVGVKVTYTFKAFEHYTEGFQTTRSTTPKVDRDTRDTGTTQVCYAAVGRNAQDVKNIIKHHGDKVGAIEWNVSPEFQTNPPRGLRHMHEG
jgi:hypothetical protein